MNSLITGWLSTLIVCLVMNSVGDARKLDGKIDLVLIVPRPFKDQGDQFQIVARTLPESHVEMGEQKVKIAIVDGIAGSNGETEILLKLTSNLSEYDNALTKDQAKGKGGLYIHTAMKTAREQVFNFDDKERAKVVIVFGPYFAGDRPKTAEEASLLRGNGAFVYVFYNQEDSDITEDSRNYTGGWSERTFGLSRDDLFVKWVEEMPKVNEAIFRDLCGWDVVCRYPSPDRDRCESKVFRPRIAIGHNPDPQNECDANKLSGRNCDNPDACETECNKRWEWSGPTDCNTCGMVVKRKTETAPEEMEHCLPEFACSCPTAKQTHKPTSSPTSKPASLPTSIPASGTTPMHSAKEPAKASSEESESPSWLIPVVVVAIIAILLIIAIIAFVVVKKKRRAAAAKIADTARMKKMVAMSKSKLQSAMIAGKEFATDVAPTKGAAASVMADLTTVEKSKTAKDKSIRSMPSGKSKQSSGGSMMQSSKKKKPK